MIEKTDYLKYRGKCKEMSEALCAEDSSLRLVRGYYFDLIWGVQAHWWCQKSDGTIIDPTKDQFPTKGNGVYEEFDDNVECSECGKNIIEEDAIICGSYTFCSGECYASFVGII